MTDRAEGLSLTFERALRLASYGHRDQLRKGSAVPYIEHPMGVALILDRAGFDAEIVIAGLLHDLVEDTEITLMQIREEFGDPVADLVAHCSEEKVDSEGRKRPWLDRKRDHVEAVLGAPDSAKAIIVADKLHNLLSIKLDLLEGRNVWETFNAGREQVLRNQAAMLDACRSDEIRLSRLVDLARTLLAEVSSIGG